MPHVTVHFHQGLEPHESQLAKLADRIVGVVSDALHVTHDVVTVSVAPTDPEAWDRVLARAVEEGPFLRRPAYPTGVQLNA